MSFLAVKQTAAAIALTCQNSIATTTVFKNGIDQFRQVPKFEKLGSKVALIVGPIENVVEHRLTNPRGAGTKSLHYTLPLWIHAIWTDEGVGGDNFDIALWIIRKAYASANVVTQITDPITAETSWLREIGEEIRIRQAEPEAEKTRGSGSVHFFAEMAITAIEDIQA